MAPPSIASIALVLFLGAPCPHGGIEGAWAQSGSRSAPTRELDRVVAIVNEDVIVASELNEKLKVIRNELRARGATPPPGPVLERQVLERLVLERLQLELADELRITVSDEELNRAVANLARQNQLSLTEFQKILARDGFDFARFRENVRQEMRIARLQQRQVANRVRVRDYEVDAWLEGQGSTGAKANEYRLSHILVAVPQGADEAQVARLETRARNVLQRLHGGEDFAAVAEEVSDAGSTAEAGGDLGWRAADRLPSLFTDVVPSMRRGEISDLIRSPSGFHIVKLEDVRGPSGQVVRQTRAQHILIQTDEATSDEDARTRLQRLRERVTLGESFEALARSHSDDRSTAVKDGNLGWVSPGDVVPAFEEAMDALEPGEVSPPFKSPFGWHIVRVLERREHDNTDEVRRNEAREAVRRRKLNEELQVWLRHLRDSAYVEYRLDQ